MDEGKTIGSGSARKWLWVSLSFLLGCVVVAKFSPAWENIRTHAEIHRQKKILDSLLLVCRAYEDDHGHFPKRLEDIVTETTLTKTGEPKPLIYRAGASWTPESTTPVIWTPERFHGKIIVAYASGRVVAEPADRIEEILGESDGSKAD